ncbi:hypothetical protein HGRIS_013983 [Hohenbuehelia grisea]|uniref:NACHT domain-containing protein n=1 Tax=Hohenbuehelia grisea TaxID=104357 RepID=A0ABR3JS93_9AGAR
MATTPNEKYAYTAITYEKCRDLPNLPTKTLLGRKSRCPVRAIVFIEDYEDAGYPIESLHKIKQDKQATSKRLMNLFANSEKQKGKSMETPPPMIFFSKPTANVEIKLYYVTDEDAFAQTKLQLRDLDGDVQVPLTSSSGSVQQNPVMTFKRAAHNNFDCSITSIGELPPISSKFIIFFANIKRFIGAGKALSELGATTPAGKVVVGLVEAIASECDGYIKRHESVTDLLKAVGDACVLVGEGDDRTRDQHRPNQIKVYQYLFPVIYRCLYFVASLSRIKLAANLNGIDGETKKLQGELRTIVDRVRDNRIEDILQIVAKIEDRAFLDSLPHDTDAGLDRLKFCVNGTREGILTHIQNWAVLPGARRALLLYGVAGKGKSAIIHAVARALEKKEASLANVAFFAFNRSAANRSIQQLLPTWAWSVASRDLQYLGYLRGLKHHELQGSPLDDQLKVLLIEGLKHTDSCRPIIFVIDALDECQESRPLLALLLKVLSSSSKLPQHCRFLFTCRPDDDILEKLNRPTLIEQVSLGDAKWHTVEDIRVFVHKKLCDWEDLAPLVDPVTAAAEGVFQCAALLCAELTTKTKVHRELFIEKLKSKDRHFDTLYGIYEQVLEAYINPKNDLRLKAFKHLMALIFLVRSPQHRDTLLPLAAATLSRERQPALDPCGDWSVLQSHEERSALVSILPLLGSLLSGSTFDANKVPVLPLHTSFRDFLVEPAKEPEEGEVKVYKGSDFSVDIGPRHQELLALACLDITNAQLRFNMCDFDTSFALNSEIEELQERVEKILAPELKYACRSAAYHLDKSLGEPDEQTKPTGPQKPRAAADNRLDAALSYFLKNCFLCWLEVHSCMGSRQDGPGGMLPRFQKWASIRSPEELVSIIADFVKFEKRFRDGYMLSAPQVYYSGLTFLPEVSKVRELYKGPFCIPTTVIHGSERIWPTTETLVIGSQGWVSSVAFSPDGAQIVSGSGDKTIRIWDAATGQQVSDALTGHKRSVSSVAFSPDGAQIVSGSGDNTIRIWDAATGQQVGDALTGHEGSVSSVAFSPDGAQIVSGSGDKTIRIWDAATGQQVGDALTGHELSVLSVAFSPDGAQIVSGSYDKTIRIWDAATGEQVGAALTGHEGSVSSVAFSPDGAQIVSGSGDNTIRIWDAATGQQVGDALTGHEGSVLSVAFSPDGAQIVSGSGDTTIRIWDAATGQQVGDALTGHERSVSSVAFSPDGAQIVSGSDDNTIRLWDAATGQQVGDALTGHDEWVSSVAFSPDGAQIVSGSDDNTICIWDAGTGQQVGDALTGHEDWVSSVAFSPEGAQIVSGSGDKTIRIWDAATGQQVGNALTGHEGSVLSVAFSPDGAQIVSGSYDKTIRIWDAATGQQVGDALTGHEGSVSSVAFSPDGAQIVSGSGDNTIRIWDAATGQQVGDALTGHEDWVSSVAFSPDGAQIVSGSGDNTIRIWDAATGQQVGDALTGHEGSVLSVAFSPDGAQIVSGSYDKTIRIWDAATGQQVGAALTGHEGSVSSVAFSPDGAQIVSGSGDNTIRIWDGATGQQLEDSSVHGQRAAFSDTVSSNKGNGHGDHMRANAASYRHGCAILRPLVRNGEWICHARNQWSPAARILWIPPVFRACNMSFYPCFMVISLKKTIFLDVQDIAIGPRWKDIHKP